MQQHALLSADCCAGCMLVVSVDVRRALGWHLLSCKGKAEMDAQQWEQDATEKQQKVAELEQEVQKVQQELEQRISSFQVWWPQSLGTVLHSAAL